MVNGGVHLGEWWVKIGDGNFLLERTSVFEVNGEC